MNMEIKILFDSTAANSRLLSGWGISYLINDSILFDTGEKSETLFNNMKMMNIRVDDIKAVVVSHDHWDHAGGLWDILIKNPSLKVYACPHFSKEFKDKVKDCKGQLNEVDKFIEISKDIYSTGEIEGVYGNKRIVEQALILNTDNGIVIVTGCAHPGIAEIIEHIKKHISGNIYLVLGGFHLMDKDKRKISSIVRRFRELGVEKVAPSHCSGKIAIELFKKEYGKNFLKIKIGKIIKI